jgi:sialate O-acetylesterase
VLFLFAIEFLGTIFFLAHSEAEVSLPHILASHMVVQRDAPIHVWGRSAAAEKISITFGGDPAVLTDADSLGNWSLSLPAHSAGGPFTLVVKGTNTITLDDVLVGDVWVASGQSNMEFAMRQVGDADHELTKVDDKQLRLIRIDKTTSAYPRYDQKNSGWEMATQSSAREFSAVAYYFAREMRNDQHVPVGVIESSWGGTPAEAWTSLSALARDAGLMGVFAARAHMIDEHEKSEEIRIAEDAAISEAKATGKPLPKFPWHPPLDSWAPGELYNSMIAPLTELPIKGVIWYQGESNSGAERAYLYARLFQALILDWRRQWNQPNLPFLFVQLANFKSTPAEDWPTIRDAQSKALELRNTGMAVTVDIGNPDDVHPVDKLDVGLRLSLIARAEVFGEQIEYSGPVPLDAFREGHTVRIRFSHGAGLMVKDGTLQSLELAGPDGIFKSATAKIEGSFIYASSSEVFDPSLARYGWTNSPVCNLYNGSHLPASPFVIAVQ